MPREKENRDTLTITLRMDASVVRQFRSICALRNWKFNRTVEDMMRDVIKEARKNKEIV